MLTIQQDKTMVLDTGHPGWVWAVAFHPDRMHVLGGGDGGIQRWRLVDGQEVGKYTGMKLRAITVSRDCKWIVCGTYNGGAHVWDAEMRNRVVRVEGTNHVGAVDVSPDSTKFATGTGYGDNDVSIWSITTGKRLVGPLRHHSVVTGIKFSPSGDHIASACLQGTIRIIDSRNGDELVTIKTTIPNRGPGITPLAWSGHQVFSTSRDNKIKSFDVSAGSQLAESSVLRDGDNDVASVALAANNKFIVTVASRSISFLDTSTLARISSVIEDSGHIHSIAVSLDSCYLATGRRDGKINIHHLHNILPELYGPFHVSALAFIVRFMSEKPPH